LPDIPVSTPSVALDLVHLLSGSTGIGSFCEVARSEQMVAGASSLATAEFSKKAAAGASDVRDAAGG
jgi:hypothetical protein